MTFVADRLPYIGYSGLTVLDGEATRATTLYGFIFVRIQIIKSYAYVAVFVAINGHLKPLEFGTSVAPVDFRDPKKRYASIAPKFPGKNYKTSGRTNIR